MILNTKMENRNLHNTYWTT